MAYRGKRQIPRGGKDAGGHPEPISNVGDPFSEEEKPSVGERCAQFFRSTGGKVFLIATACIVLLAAGAITAWSIWVKPPELPAGPADNTQTVTPPAQDKTQTPQPETPSDDELYPDDGYMGEMPALSGDRKKGVYTFLLVGTDLDDGNTDTIMVASYDTVNQDVDIMSIPRDTMVNVKWDIKRINSVYSYNGRSIDALKKQVAKVVGFTPDFYAKVDLSMFIKLVDLVEGVEFDVPQDMNYDDPAQNLHIHLKKGVQVLDGQSAMELVRFRRYPEGDIKRVEVQQAFMKALIKECLAMENWGKIKAYIDLAMENVQTDLEVGSVVWFAANVLGLNKGTAALKMENVETYTLPGNYNASAYSRAVGNNQSYVTIYPRQVVDLVNEKFNPYEQKVSTSMLDAMSILKNGDIASSTGSLRDTRHNAIMAVRRGEAYYDEDGKIVYGKKPAEPEGPKQDEEGRYYTLDEDGNTVYTDKDGKPLEDPQLPSWIPGSGGTFAEDPNGGSSATTPPDSSGTQNPDPGAQTPDSGAQATDPGQTTDPGTQPDQPGQGGPGTQTPGEGDPSQTAPEEPVLPPEEPTAPPPAPEPEPEPQPQPDNQIPGWLLTQ